MLTTTEKRQETMLSTATYRCFLLFIFLLPAAGLAGVPSGCGGVLSTDDDSTKPAPAVGGSCKALIGSINIINGSVFDLDDPDENKPLYRLANKIHVTTRPRVIQQQLLFATGDRLSVRKLQESERILRSNRYIYDAKIEPVLNENGLVDVNVRTTDVWTLEANVSVSRSGGQNNSGLGIQDLNLFGTGIELGAIYSSNVDRDSMAIRVADSHLGDSWYKLSAVYVNNSDGHTYMGNLGKPFYALDSTSANGISFLDDEKIDTLYDRGEVLAGYRAKTRSFELFKGWSTGLKKGWARRFSAGLAYDDRRFSPVDSSIAPISLVPDDRKLVYPFVGIEFVQDKFEKTENQDQIDRTEDRYLGTLIGARIGTATKSFGSDRDAWIVNLNAETGFGHTQTRSLILGSKLATRVEGSKLRNFAIDVSAKYYNRQSESRLFYASLSGTYGRNLDVDNQLLLGGDNGLRGYPLRYQTGSQNALLTIEQRFFTNWYPFRLFRVGGAVFFDAGRTWGRSPVSSRENGLLKDVGFGLRIGNTRSGLGRITHIDLAFPLDGDQNIKNVQLLVQTKKSF